MRLLVDLDDKAFKMLKSGEWCGHTTLQAICTAIINGVPIPDNATNGEFLKMMYPSLKIIGHFMTSEERIMVDFGDDDSHDFELDWWNAPYKKGGTE